jgi:hypothetical protein
MFKPKSMERSGVFYPSLWALYFWSVYELRNHTENNRITANNSTASDIIKIVNVISLVKEENLQ